MLYIYIYVISVGLKLSYGEIKKVIVYVLFCFYFVINVVIWVI